MNTISKKNISFLSVMDDWGGGEEFLKKLCTSLPEFNFKIFTPPGDASEKFSSAKIKSIEIKELQKIRPRSSGWRLIEIIKLLFCIVWGAIKVSIQIKKNNDNLLIANGIYAGMYAVIIKALTGIDIVIVQHLIYEKNSFEAKVIAAQLKFAKLFVCVSQAVKNNINELLSTEKYDHKINVILNGIKLPEFQSTDTLAQFTNVKNIVLAGSIIKIKGFDLVLEALNSLKQNTNFHLHIYGNHIITDESKKYFTSLKDYAEKNLTNKVSFHGFESSKEKIYSNADVIINFSTIPESFSMIVAEAMSYGKVVISADSGGPLELIEDGVNGYFAEMKNVQSLAAKIEHCLDETNNTEINKIKSAARKTAEERFSEEIFLNNYSKLFNSLVN